MFTRRTLLSGANFAAVSKRVTRGSSILIESSINARPTVPVYSSSLVIPSRSIFSKITGKPSGFDLTVDLQKSKSDAERVDKLRQMTASFPSQAAMILHSGIIEGKFIGNEYIRQYLSALSKSGQLDKVDMGSLLGVIGRAQSGSQGLINRTAASLGGPSLDGVTASGVQGNGSSATTPLYVMNMGSNPSFKSRIPELLLKFITMLVLVSIIYELMSEATAGVGGGMGKMSKSAVHRAEKSTKRFDDVLGIDEAKHELQEIVMYLKDPSKFTRLGGKLPAGVLLTGPPGTGKTLLARAIAGEANVPFFYSSGSEFEEMFVGVGAKRVRELFKEAKAHAPCIVFIDEVDAIGGKRNEKDQSTHRMTLNQLLVELDGFEKNSGIIIVAATNFPQSLDPALVRPGRFDKRVNIPTPDIKGRKEILAHYVKSIVPGPDVDLEQISRGTPGFSGAELENLVNQAAVYAAVEELKYVTMEAFEHAKDKILMGEERKSAVLSPSTMKNTAYHEAGHAVVALLTEGAEPVHKATIMPRGRALGMVMQLPEGDQTSMSLKEMYARLDVCYGGRIAEEIFFGKENVTSGASSDIEQATKLARAIVSKWGLSDKIGPVLVDESSSSYLLSEVDKEVKRILDESYQRCKTLMEKNRSVIETVALSLLEYETLSGKEIADITKGIKIDFEGKRSQGPSRPISIISPYQRKKKSSNPDKMDIKSSAGPSGSTPVGGLPSPAPVTSVAHPSAALKAANSSSSITSNNNNSISSSAPANVAPRAAAASSSNSSNNNSSNSSIGGGGNKASTETSPPLNDGNGAGTSRIRGPPKL